MIRLVPNDSRCGACGADANGSRLCWRCQAQQDVIDTNRHGSLPDPTPDEPAGHGCFDWTATPDPNDPDNVWICDRCGARIVAEEQARLDLSQDAPNDRAVQVFREEIAAHGDPTLATVKAMDAWLFAAPTKRGGV